MDRGKALGSALMSKGKSTMGAKKGAGKGKKRLRSLEEAEWPEGEP